MTHIYQLFSIPRELTVVCPRCAGKALARLQCLVDYRQPLEGSLDCMSCHHHVDGHIVKWPNDAFYRCDVRGHELWAWSEGHARAIRAFVDGKIRKARSRDLLHLPSFFLRAKHRAATVKALDRMLA